MLTVTDKCRAAAGRGGSFFSCGLSAIGWDGSAVAALLFGALGSSIRATDVESGLFDVLAEGFKMIEGFFSGSVAEDDGELFASAAEGLAVASDIG